jgi:proline dehydrogenase
VITRVAWAWWISGTPSRLVGLFSKRYIAESAISDALKTTRDQNERGCAGTIDVLGEEITSPEESSRFTSLYLETLEKISRARLDSNVSVMRREWP